MGGTFNPVHNGHLLLAEGAKKLLKLDQVLWIPAHIAPHKTEADKSCSSFDKAQDERSRSVSPEDRAEMVELAIRDHPSFQLSRVELERPPPSYTIDTVRQIQEQFKDSKNEWFLLVGSDTARELPTWREYDRLKQLVQPIAIPRPGKNSDPLPAGVREIPVKTPDISSSEIRELIRQGQPIQSLVPEPVYRYIEKRRLYR
ncbi:MAG: nicotinate (nicotinamide) nucleotide adenylyltransferase [Candidatus Omnitrophica bacterium]|nr:nicotinate (nicotinamide) nucleotide adenylyltransferase [Candidatus Omnitrophota bacterium]